MKSSMLFKTFIISLLFLLSLTVLSARVVESRTLTIYASVPPKTSVSFDADGFPVLSTNTPGTELAVVEQSADSYLFEVTSR
ncbi:MAG: hypothetical protein JXK93_01055 [Sphaerochaetaceae bacterium]|nr:hypothetical protein [Sphaerochaetaceae bacterium]